MVSHVFSLLSKPSDLILLQLLSFLYFYNIFFWVFNTITVLRTGSGCVGDLWPGLKLQGWEFALLHKIAHFKEQPWAICSRCSLLKIDHEQISLFALYKRATAAKKKQCEWFARNLSESLLKTSNLLEKIHIFCLLFTAFPLFMPKSKSLPSLFAPSLFFKEQPWANRSCRSLQKGNRERFAPVTFYKRATGAISSFSTANRSFAHKKRAICLKTK